MRECPGELRAKQTQQKCIMGRRTFLGLGGAAALMALLGPRVAWGGVGGGPWGAYGDTALPGAHFGYDAG
ncbi:MAG: hypothetical protein RRZ85_05160, partial [Gordonibacter sp.]